MHTQTKPTPETLAALAVEIHANAVNKGFWDAEPDIEKFLMLIVCELAEAVEADRKGRRANTNFYGNVSASWSNQLRKGVFEREIKDTVEDELADAAIRILDMAEHLGMTGEIAACQGVGSLFMVDSSFAGKVYRIVRYMPSGRMHESFPIHLKVVLGSIFALAESLKIDLLWHIREKMAYNATREKLHGKKY